MDGDRSGYFITIEGGEGAGKTSCLATVAASLKARGWEVTQTREPGGTRLGEAIRALLLNRDSHDMSVDTELLLMFAARAQHLDEVVRPALAAGGCVVCDRFTDASYAYQGGGRGVADRRIGTLETWVQGTLRPDLTLLLDIPVEVGLARTVARGQAPDRFELEQVEFFERVRSAYLRRAEAEPERFCIIDAAQPVDKVRNQIERALSTRLPMNDTHE